MADNDYRIGTRTEPFFRHRRNTAAVPSVGRPAEGRGKYRLDAEAAGDPVGVAPSATSRGALGSSSRSYATLAHSVTVPGRYTYLKWWKFVLVVLGVWIGAGEVGLSFTGGIITDKTAPCPSSWSAVARHRRWLDPMLVPRH